MRHEAQNPVLAPFRHLLSKKGRYPAKHVDIFWNRDGSGRVRDVEVVFIPREALRDNELQAQYSQFNKRWSSDLGNSTSEWLEKNGYTPEDIFGHLLQQRFSCQEETVSALQEFSHIEECDWARRMLRGFKDE